MSSTERVTDPQAVRLLLQPRVREVLGVFLHAESTVGAAARALNMDIRRVHRDVQSLRAAGLLHETRLEARAGRPIRHYRASAPAYFVPRALAPDADYAERLERQYVPLSRTLARASGREFERAIAEQGHGREWGLRLYWDGEAVQIDESYEDAELRGILTGWQGPNVLIFGGLSAGPLLLAEASEVQAEFIRLLTRLSGLFEANRAAGRGQPFAVWGVLTPVNEAELVVFKS